MKYLALILIIFLVGCSQLPVDQQCEEWEGTWTEHNECESISEKQCTKLDGEFNECASACRHDPLATLCTLQCVPVCTPN